MKYKIRRPDNIMRLHAENLIVTSSDLDWLLGKPMQYVREYVEANKYELWVFSAAGWVRVLPCIPVPATPPNKRGMNQKNIQG